MQRFKPILGVAAVLACAACEGGPSQAQADLGAGGSTGGSVGGLDAGPGGGGGGATGGSTGGATGGNTGGSTGGSAGGSTGGDTGGSTGGTTGGTGGQIVSPPDAGADVGPICVPVEEVCDGLDNDCDGVADNTADAPLTEICYDGPAGTEGQAACHAGARTCLDARWGACEGQVLPAVEICDLADNDCNGLPDDVGAGGCTCAAGTAQDCYAGPPGTAGQGLCLAGRQSCLDDGTAWGPCDGQVLPADETCDGRDEDCDGQADDALPGAGDACMVGLGQCTATGVRVCNPASGEVQCDTRPGLPLPEACNGLDDDCNGSVDDGLGVGDACAVGVGECHREGQVTCDALSGALTCSAVAGAPSPEACNGRDDNCDGAADEGNPGGGGACDSGRPGVCAAGTLDCQDATLSCVPHAAPDEERCNRLDDDCDGSTDEDAAGGPLHERCYAGPVGTDGVGACRAGSITCHDGQLGACVGEVLPGLEVCNGLDDDCNGRIDDVPGVGDQCSLGVGICEAAGVVLCDPDAGALYCNATPGEPRRERCNGLDDDCNGGVDDFEVRVGVMGGSFYTDDARAYLDSLPNVAAVVNEACDPASLDEFDALLLYGNMSCFDEAAFSDYVFGGGGLIGTPWTLSNNGGLQALPVADAATSEYSTRLQVSVVDPASPLMTLVNFEGGDGACDAVADVPYVGDVDCVGYNAPITLRPGAHLVASNDAAPGGIAVADWDYGAGHAVYLDFHYITSDTAVAAVYPWGRQLLRNAVEVATDCSVGPQLACPPGHAGPAPEACNGIDDDCDGSIDNLPDLGLDCTVGEGLCFAAGVTVCDARQGAVICSARPGNPAPELCDGLDNDCDGTVDEGGVCFRQVGSFSVDDGPAWGGNPPSYSCVEACALLFGGAAAQYQCSTVNGQVNNRAHVSGWGDGQYCVNGTVAENFKSPANGGYDCGGVGCSYSAYVADHCGADAVNYCWR